MKVIFFCVENVLNFAESDAVAPSGRKGIAEARVKQLRNLAKDTESKIVLFGEWKKDWDFADEKCTKDGIYLNKKLDRKGLHILDKVDENMDDDDGINDWIRRRPNVTDYCILRNFNEIRWMEL